MLRVGVLCALGAAVVVAIVRYVAPFDLLVAFLVSWIAIALAGAAIMMRLESIHESGASSYARAGAGIVVLVILGLAVKPYLALCQEFSGFWENAFLLWLVYVALMLLGTAISSTDLLGTDVYPSEPERAWAG